MLSGKAAKCIFTFPELHFYSLLFYGILWTLVQYLLYRTGQIRPRVSFDWEIPVHVLRGHLHRWAKSGRFFSIWNECRSQKSQLFTQTIGSGGDRFGKLFELMDQVSFQDYSKFEFQNDIPHPIWLKLFRLGQ